MTIERIPGSPRHRIFCLSDDLTAGQSAGIYILNNSAVAAELGEGSEIIVIDAPGRLLFWDSVKRLAHDWTGADHEL